MAYVPRGGNQTGGRGRGRGGGPAPRRGGGSRGGGAPPLAAQLRQLDRLQEPEEMTVLRRYKDIGATQVRSSYGVGGLLDRMVQVPDQDGNLEWLSVARADNALQQKRLLQERERALARQEVRLPENRRRRSWGQLTPEDRRLLLLSQKEYNSFRARTGAGAPAQQAPQAPQAPQQDPIVGPAEDGGDDASDAGEEEN